MNSLPTGYLVDLNGDRRLLSGPGPVYRTVQKDVEPPVMYRRRPVAKWTGSVPQETVALLARLDEIAQQHGNDRSKALEQMASIYREWAA